MTIFPIFTKSRIIPADAGSTTPLSEWLTGRGDHPRGCGEHLVRIQLGERNKGSSPRMRGAHCSLLPTSYGLRIIPADAGSTIRSTVYGLS